MSNLKIKKTPGEFIVAGNQSIFKVISPNKYGFGIYTTGYIQLQVTSAHVNGNKMTFTNGFGSTTLTCLTTPLNDGASYPPTSGELYAWVALLVNYLRENPFLVQHYDITHDSIQQDRIYLKARIKGDEPKPVLSDAPSGTSLINDNFTSGLVLPEGYKISLLAEKQVVSSWGTSANYKSVDGAFDFTVREPTLSEVIKDPTNYLRAAVLDCNVSFLFRKQLFGHYSFPEPTSVLYKEWDILEWRRFFFFEKQGLPAVTGAGIYSEAVYSLPGELSELKQAIINTDYDGFENWMNATGSFLTFSPVKKYIDANQPERLYWLCRKTETVKLKIVHTYSDESTATFSTNISMTKGKVYELFLNWEKARMGVTAKEISKYRVYLTTSADVRMSEYRDYMMDVIHKPFARYFFFRNSFGVYECMRTHGYIMKTLDVSKQTSLRELNPGFGSKDVREMVTNVTAINTYLFNSGPLCPEMAVFFQEFLDSDDVIMLRNGRVFPVVIAGAKVPLYSDQQDNNNIPFELRHSINDDFAINLDVYSSAYKRDFNNDFNSDFNK